MVTRIILAFIVVASLIALLLYSQTRVEEPRVSGYIEAEVVRLGSRVGGRVQEVLVDEGQTVEAGQILVRLEEFDLDERQSQFEAELRAKEAELKRLKSGFREEEKGQAEARVRRLEQKLKALVEGPRPEEIEQARARVRLAQAQLDLAQANYDRNAALFEQKRGTVTREDLDRSIEDLKVAQSSKDVRDQELQLMEKGTREEQIAEADAELAEAKHAQQLTINGSRPEDIEQAEAAVAAARAAIDVLTVSKDELEISSPAAGVVDAIDLHPGDLVAASAPVLSIVESEKLFVRAYVPESRLGFKVGHKLKVTVDSFPGEEFEGVVTFISRQAEFTPSNVQTPEERAKQVFRIELRLPSNDRLRPGMAADVWLEK